MIVVKMIGGLGNQMFQYSLYLKLKSIGKEVKIDTSLLDGYLAEHMWMDIFNVFGLDFDKADSTDINSLSDNDKSIVSRIRRRLLGVKKTHYFEREEGCFDPTIVSLNDAYLEGYWQSDKYFSDIRDMLIDKYRFSDNIDEKNRGFKQKILDCENSVSVHFRLGDYLDDNNRKIYGGICTQDYYDRAIDYFRNKYNNCTFFIFSNDKDAIKKYRKAEDFVVVDCNDDKNGWCDMYLMSICKHNIIANSSFSWWGAWLNNSSNKDVIAPSKWLNTKEMIDICPSEWTRM